MRSVDVLLDYVANFLSIDVMLLQKHIFLLICRHVENVIDASREKNTFTLAESIRFYDISNFLFAVGLVLQEMVSEIHILIGKHPCFREEIILGRKRFIHTH